jgi:hypothetical protein
VTHGVTYGLELVNVVAISRSDAAGARRNHHRKIHSHTNITMAIYSDICLRRSLFYCSTEVSGLTAKSGCNSLQTNVLRVRRL